MTTRDEALASLEARKAQAKILGKVNNASLYAGSPMYFYCRVCGLETDVLPESYTEEPCTLCTPCEELKVEST
jgi:hypothetical protein